MLYYTADLPFPVTHTPDNFNAFRKEVEFLVEIRRALPVPSVQQNNLEHLIDEGIIPGPVDFGFSQKEYTNMEIIAKGGEDEAIDQLQRYIQAEKNVEERADIILSPYLSHGCLSPKYFYWTFYEHKRHLENTSLNKEVYLKLLKRDHYRLIGKKFGVQIFNVQGIDPNAQKNLKINKDLLTAWIDGQTGIPGVDANMIKLRKTGYIDFAARVICARFFVEELNLDWTIGASYFESALIDYDPCSNWVQWMCIGGVGMERFDQKNINYQELYKTKDKEGIYLTRWLPVLSNVPAEFRHFPSSMDEPVLKHLNFEMGKDYPMPII
jgi:deoxyribodipyrimidine photo-lyase